MRPRPRSSRRRARAAASRRRRSQARSPDPGSVVLPFGTPIRRDGPAGHAGDHHRLLRQFAWGSGCSQRRRDGPRQLHHALGRGAGRPDRGMGPGRLPVA
jgi:hypothetical protein